MSYCFLDCHLPFQKFISISFPKRKHSGNMAINKIISPFKVLYENKTFLQVIFLWEGGSRIKLVWMKNCAYCFSSFMENSFVATLHGWTSLVKDSRDWFEGRIIKLAWLNAPPPLLKNLSHIKLAFHIKISSDKPLFWFLVFWMKIPLSWTPHI